MFSKLKTLLALASASLLAAPLAHAGPPLICHPYEIGAAKSLPGGSDWHGVAKNYDTKNLHRDTLALLTADTPVLVRMETLRRAAIFATNGMQNWGRGYTAEERALGLGLLEKLQGRVANVAPANRALALFDAGFFAETLRQAGMDPGLDGFALLTQAAALRPKDAEIDFALALASMGPNRKDNRDYLVRARAAAKENPLLATNLASHFGKS